MGNLAVKAKTPILEVGNKSSNLLYNKEMHVYSSSQWSHVGSLNPQHKQNNSMEGNGLSISEYPEEWRQIAKLGEEPIWSVSKQNGRFFDIHRNSEWKDKILQVALKQGWVEKVPSFLVHFTDLETEEKKYMLMESKAVAELELDWLKEDDPDAYLEEKIGWALTDAAHQRLGFKPSNLLAYDMAACFYIEDFTPLDGVWWNDTLDVYDLSAPRAVIVPSKLSQWQFNGQNYEVVLKQNFEFKHFTM